MKKQRTNDFQLNPYVIKAIAMVLIVFLCWDLYYSYLQFMTAALDGDMASIIVPSVGYTQVMSDPFALSAVINQEQYAAPNRFFAHFTMAEYYKRAPLFFQGFTDPINSIYMAGAVAKTLIQIAIIYLLAAFAGNTRKVFSLQFLIPAVLIAALFQNSVGFTQLMGIIDLSNTYAFFYALPVAGLLMVFYFLLKPWYYGRKAKFNILTGLLLLVFSVALPLSGPLIPPMVVLIFMLVFLQQWISSKQASFLLKTKEVFEKQSGFFWFLVILISFMSVYSLYAGTYNAEQQWSDISLSERFSRLPLGLWIILSTKMGWPVLIALFTINLLILRFSYKSKSEEAAKILRLFSWFLIFAFLYLLLLPLGGYRSYRPNIIRYDTFIPMTIGVILIYAKSSLFLLKNLKIQWKMAFAALSLAGIVFFTVSDLNISYWNWCEREALQQLSNSNESLVPLPSTCSVFAWTPLSNPEDSRLNAILLKKWNVTDEVRLYYNFIPPQ